MIYSISIRTPVGILMLQSDERFLKSVSFDNEAVDDSPWLPDVLIQTRKQLTEYFLGTRQKFDLPLDPDGTDFQHLVWKKLEAVDFGTTKSYVEIARSIGLENASRAVGMANGRNPIPIIIPCHRIVGHNGKLTGYAGGLERKKWLLLHEQRYNMNSWLF